MQKYLYLKQSPSPKFLFPDIGSDYFKKLKSDNSLEISNVDAIKDAKKIAGYVHSLWLHNGDTVPVSSEPIDIINEAKVNTSGFRCVEYSIVATALFWAYGIPARTLSLKKRDVETEEYRAGHVVVEFWSKQLSKWIEDLLVKDLLVVTFLV